MRTKNLGFRQTGTISLTGRVDNPRQNELSSSRGLHTPSYNCIYRGNGTFAIKNPLTAWRQPLVQTRNIFKKDIRRLSNTDNKRNQIRWFRRNSHLPLCMLESKTSEVVGLFLPLFRLVLCTSNSFRWAICIRIFFLILGIHQQGFGNNVLSP